jgi:hypothetical protein
MGPSNEATDQAGRNPHGRHVCTAAAQGCREHPAAGFQWQPSGQAAADLCPAIGSLARYRGKGQQKVIVEHVHVHSGGQAIVGAVNSHPPPGGGGATKTEHQPHALEHAQGETLPSAIEARTETVPVSGG